MRSNAIMNIENKDKYCFLMSLLAFSCLCYNNQRNRVSNLKQNFDELNIRALDFTNGFKCSDVHKLKEMNNLTVTIFALNFYQDQNNWRHKLIPIEVSKNYSDRVIDLIIYKKHYALFKKIRCIFRRS